MVVYVLNIFNSIFCCFDIRQSQMILTSQHLSNTSLSAHAFHKCWQTVFYFESVVKF